jgi:glycosyltransferase involved in cell wall biosynthesis
VDEFSKCGFAHARVVPYPITPNSSGPGSPDTGFRHFLFAGAAREDKGFDKIVDLIQLLKQTDSQLPFVLQSSSDLQNKQSEKTQSDLQRLGMIGYGYLHQYPSTLNHDEYIGLYAGGICFQPYNVTDFTDRISGVTLDALSAGCPVVTIAGTWMARTVERFNAGVVIADTAPAEMIGAAQRILADYAAYRANALRAGETLQRENNALHLFDVLVENSEPETA